MRPKKLKVGIIGAGIGGKALLEIFHDDPVIEVVGVADRNPGAAGMRLAAGRGIAVTDDYRTLARKDLQIIIDVTGSDRVRSELQRIKRPGAELMGGRSSWVLWKLVEERKKSADERERVSKKREILYQLGLIANNANSLSEAGNTIVDYAAMLTYTPASSVAIFDERKEHMYILAAKGMSPSFGKRWRCAIRKGSLASALFNRKDPLIIPHLKGGKLPGSILAKEGVRSMMACPMIADGRFMGFIQVSDFKKRSFDREDIGLFSIFTMNAALILERIKNIEEMRLLSITDGLTGLYNHRHLMERLGKEIQRAERQKSTFAFLLFDIDRFKDYNDAYGHLEGNRVLRGIADVFTKAVRTTDTVARFGGEEFCIIALDLSPKRARELVERLQAQLAAFDFPHRKITLSGGVSFYPKEGRTQVELIKKADDRLYTAKSLGRDRIVFS